MKRIFWFALGVGVAAFVVARGKALLYKVTPAGVTEQVTQTSRAARGRIAEFMTDLTTAMDEREAELREQLNMPETS